MADQKPAAEWNRDILVGQMDDCLIAIEDGKDLRVGTLDALPPWRAVLLARVADKAGVGIDGGYTLAQLVDKAREVGGDAGPAWLTGRPHRTCGECLRTSFDMRYDEHEVTCSQYPVPMAQRPRNLVRTQRHPFGD